MATTADSAPEKQQQPAIAETKPEPPPAASAPAPEAAPAPAPDATKEKNTAATAEQDAAGAACEFDPSADFKGDLQVSQDLPTEKDVKKCEDLLVLGADGESRPFKSLYSGEGVASRQLIIFVRHFFCGNCQEFLRSLSASVTPDALLALPTPTFITIVGCGRPELIPMYVQTTNCPFPVFADPTTKLYSQLGMTRTLSMGPKRPDYIKTGTAVNAVTSMIQCIKSGKGIVQGGDLRQVGGEMLFEDGEVTWVHRMKNTRDHAEIDELRKVLGLNGKDEGRRQRSNGFKAMSRSMSWNRRQERSKERSRSREDRVVEADEKAGDQKAKDVKKNKRRSLFARAETHGQDKAAS